MKRVWRVLLSRAMAVSAMAAMALLLALATLAPDPSQAGFEEMRRRHPFRAAVLERVELGRMTRSPAFLVLPGFIALSVAASMWQRIRARLRGGRREAHLERFVERRSVQVGDDLARAAARLEEALARSGFPRGRGEGCTRHGSRGDAGFAGSMLFHAGLLTVLVGIALSALGRFGGELVLTEDVPASIVPGALARASPPDGLGPLEGLRVTASDVAVEFVRDVREPIPEARSGMVDIAAVVGVERDGSPPRRLFTSVNEAASVDGYQLSIHRYGFAPEIRAQDPQGRVRAEGIGVVKVIPAGTEDAIHLDGGGELRLSFYPDFDAAAPRPASRSPRLLRPVLAWRWIENGAVVATGLVERGSESEAGGYRVAFPSLRYWLDFIVSRDPGLPWFAAGAFLGVAGLMLRFVRHEQAWTAQLAAGDIGTRIDLAVSARYFPALLAERAERVASRLEGKRSGA